MAKKLLRRELFAFLWEKLEQDIPKQCYELEVTSDQAEYSGYELVKKMIIFQIMLIQQQI